MYYSRHTIKGFKKEKKMQKAVDATLFYLSIE